MILGVLALTTIAGSRGVDMLRGNLGYIVRIVPGAPEANVNRMKQTVISLPSTASFVYSSAEDILASESEYIGDDITELIDVNPYSAEFDVKVTPANADADSIAAIVAVLEETAFGRDRRHRGRPCQRYQCYGKTTYPDHAARRRRIPCRVGSTHI